MLVHSHLEIKKQPQIKQFVQSEMQSQGGARVLSQPHTLFQEALPDFPSNLSCAEHASVKAHCFHVSSTSDLAGTCPRAQHMVGPQQMSPKWVLVPSFPAQGLTYCGLLLFGHQIIFRDLRFSRILKPNQIKASSQTPKKRKEFSIKYTYLPSHILCRIYTEFSFGIN